MNHDESLPLRLHPSTQTTAVVPFRRQCFENMFLKPHKKVIKKKHTEKNNSRRRLLMVRGAQWTTVQNVEKLNKNVSKKSKKSNRIPNSSGQMRKFNWFLFFSFFFFLDYVPWVGGGDSSKGYRLKFATSS